MLIIGGTTTAVDQACAAAARGWRVLLVESRPYLATERCALLVAMVSALGDQESL